MFNAVSGSDREFAGVMSSASLSILSRVKNATLVLVNENTNFGLQDEGKFRCAV